MSDTAISSSAEPTRILRTFRLCDPRGQLIASVSLDASVEIEPEPGVTAEEALRRLQAGFRLTFERIRKGKEAEGMYQSDGEPKQEKKPRKVLTDEHKQRMQEGRRAAKGEGEGGEVPQKNAYAASLAPILLSRIDGTWKGKADILASLDGPVANGDWSAAIGLLLETGKIEKQGQKRGSQYRRTS